MHFDYAAYIKKSPHSVIVYDCNMIISQIDEFPVNEAVALQLAGLQAQVLWGTFDPNLTSRYDEIEQFLPLRIIQSNKSKTREDWKKAIGNAHKVRGNRLHRDN